MLSDSEKQFLILKSLLLMAGQKGGILVDEDEWFSLSPTFRSRAEGLAKSLMHGDLRLKTQILYLAPHLWSSAGTLWEELYQRVGASARLVSSIDRVIQDREAELLIVDPLFIFTQENLLKLTAWARLGRVVVIPRSPLYTEAARAEIEQMLLRGSKMDIDLGVSYQLQSLEDGKLVFFDLPEGLSLPGEALSAWQTFLDSILNLAGVQPHCGVSDGRLKTISLEKKGSGGGVGLFVLNGTHRQISADVLFRGEVLVSDLAVAFSGKLGVNEQAGLVPASRFSTDIPSCGVLPLSVEGLGAEAEERRIAAMTSEILRSNVMDVAGNELPGLDPSNDFENLWS